MFTVILDYRWKRIPLRVMFSLSVSSPSLKDYLSTGRRTADAPRGITRCGCIVLFILSGVTESSLFENLGPSHAFGCFKN
jgi:hypothetical protein